MKKRIILFFIIIILFSSVLINTGICDINKYSNIADLDVKTENIQRYYQVMTEPIEFKNNLNNEIPVSVIVTPDEFNWKDNAGKDWTTPAKDQGNCGSCWDFAAIGALESIIKIRENRSEINPDLSEQYVLSCLPAAANNYGEGCLGGTPFGAFYYMMDSSEEGNDYNGAIPETCFPYQANDDILCSDKCENWIDYLIPISDCGQSWLGFDSVANRDSIKSLIYQLGPISAGINVTNEFIQYWALIHNENNYYPDTNEPWGNRLNHIIVIIGWKDDESIENGGYWICKNSWGTEWGYNGFFNIEYGGLFIGYYIAWVDYVSENQRPSKPITPYGITNGNISMEYSFSSSCIDPNGDDVYYLFDWGDGSNSDWIGPFESGLIVEINHSWNGTGNYDIKVKAKDIHNYESEWSDPLSITMPKNKFNNLKDIFLQFYVDNILRHTETDRLLWLSVPWEWKEPSFFMHTLKVIAYDKSGDSISDEIVVWKFL